MRSHQKHRASNKKAPHRRPRRLNPEDIFDTCSHDGTDDLTSRLGHCCRLCFLAALREVYMEADRKQRSILSALGR